MCLHESDRAAQWYAVRTRSHFEKKTAMDLSVRGLDLYLPVLKQVRQWKDRRKLVEFPLFPGYLFARFPNTAEARLAVLSSCGAVSILGRCGSIEPVPESEIQSVQRLLESKADCLAHPLLKEGAWVCVNRGPLKGMEGLLIRFRKQSRLVVSVELLSQSVSAEIDASDVDPVRRPSGS